MQFLNIILLLTTVVALGQVATWFLRGDFAAGIFGSAYVVIYLFDIVNISLGQSTYIAASVGFRTADPESISLAIFFLVATWWIFSIAIEFTRKAPLASATLEIQSIRKFSQFRFLIVSGIFGFAVISKILSVGIAETMELRQSVFSDNFLILLGYFILPVLVSLGLAFAIRLRGPSAALIWLTLAVLLTITALTGSRSGLFLGAIIPVMALAWKRISSSSRSLRRDFQRVVLVVALVAVPIFGGSVYLANTRGLVESGSFLDGTDVSQADVLVDLISSQAGGDAGGSTYLASLTSAVPRSLWPGKPLPGNVVTSTILTPERYYFSGAETTAGLVGEAYINVGLAAPLVAGALIVGFLLVCRKFLESRDEIVWMVGIILLIRGLNLLRGDMTNVVVPAMTAIVVWLLIHRRQKVASVGAVARISS